MKRWILLFIILGGQIFFAQTGKEIISKNIELSGGLVRWKLLNSVITSGKVTLGIKDKYPIKIYQARPNLTKTTIFINKKETTVEGYDGKKAYAMNYVTNKLQENANYTPQSFDNDFIDFENKGFIAKYLGEENVNEILCYKVELIKNVNKITYYFDTKTYMLLKEEKKDETLLYSDYRQIGNLVFPFKIEGIPTQEGGAYTIEVSSIEINKVIPENIFKFNDQ